MSSVAPARVLQEMRVLKRAVAILVDVDVSGVRHSQRMQLQCVIGESVSRVLRVVWSSFRAFTRKTEKHQTFNVS